MFNLFISLYERPCNKFQSFLNSNIPYISKDFVKSSYKNFVYSFSVSTLLSGGNLISGLKGGSFALIATTIHAICMGLIRKIYSLGNRPSKKTGSNEAITSTLLSLASTLYLGKALGLPLNHKATFFATFPFNIFRINNQQTPIFGTVLI